VCRVAMAGGEEDHGRIGSEAAAGNGTDGNSWTATQTNPPQHSTTRHAQQGEHHPRPTLMAWSSTMNSGRQQRP
jgi:hypothetical protein